MKFEVKGIFQRIFGLTKLEVKTMTRHHVNTLYWDLLRSLIVVKNVGRLFFNKKFMLTDYFIMQIIELIGQRISAIFKWLMIIQT